MLYIPVLLLITQGYLSTDAISTHALIKEQCLEFVKEATSELNKKASEGSEWRGLCIPAGDDVKAAPRPSNASTEGQT